MFQYNIKLVRCQTSSYLSKNAIAQKLFLMAHVKSVLPVFGMRKTILWWLSNAPQKHFRHKWSVPNSEIHTCKLERNEFIIMAEMIFVLVLLLNALSKIYYPETLPIVNLDKCWKLLVNFALQLSHFSFNDHGKFFFFSNFYHHQHSFI